MWKDKWTLTPGSYKITTPINTLHEDSYVHELIDEDMRCWKNDVIDQVFLSHEAETIKGIPLSSMVSDDKLVWIGNANGKFTVRSAYYLAFNLHLSSQNVQGETSNGQDWQGRWWKALWGMNCPAKVKHFAWRACCNILPTKNALALRHVVISRACPLCHVAEESVMHILWKCKMIKKIWQEVFGSHWVSVWDTVQRCSSVIDVAVGLFEGNHGISVERIWVIAWFIWNRRNKLVMLGDTKDLASVTAEANAWLLEWDNINSRASSVTIKERVHWKPPNELCFKVNFDGAIFKEERKAGVGAVIRNHKGELMVAMTNVVHHVIDSEVIEALAAVQAIDLALSTGFTAITL